MNDHERIRYALDQIEEQIGLVLDFLDGLPFGQSGLKTQYAVLKAFENIAEASNRIPEALKARVSGVSWRGVRDFRNWIVHQYDEVDPAVVESAVRDELPRLSEAIKSLRRLLSEGGV